MLEEYPDILTPQEAMEILGIGKNLFYRLLKDGTIPAKRIGGKVWRIAKKELIRLQNLAQIAEDIIGGE